ncbi:MAG: glycosyltransferase [Sphingobium sp.]
MKGAADDRTGRGGALPVCFPFTGDVVGGSHFSVLGLVENLDPARYVPVIVPQYPEGAVAKLFRDHGIRTETPFGWTEMPYDRSVSPWKAVQVARDLPSQIRYLRSRPYRIVHTNDGRTHATWALAARLSGARLLWHQRGDPGALGLRLAAPLLANQVVAVSQFASPRPGLWSAARKARVVHSAFATDIQEDRSAARAQLVEELGCDPRTLFIGFFGAFISRKRPHLFIDAVAELSRRDPSRPVMGLLFGEAYDGGKTERELEDHARSCGAGDIIRQMGFRTPGPRWLAACDMLLVSAYGEPFGRTLIEAMLVGTPVVATASGGNIEALCEGRTGILVPAEDAAALANGAQAVLNRPDRALAMASAAMASAKSRFGDRIHAERIMAVYDEMLRLPRPKAAGRSATSSTPVEAMSLKSEATS